MGSVLPAAKGKKKKYHTLDQLRRPPPVMY
jgi:hypothetical protein